MKQITITGPFDDLRSRDVRLLEEASRLGEVTVLLWPDAEIQRLTGKPAKFPYAERHYLLQAVRFITRVIPLSAPINPNSLPVLQGLALEMWVEEGTQPNLLRAEFCRRHQIEYHVIPARQLEGFPQFIPPAAKPGRKRVVVTGCFDWFHSGHVRFFEEVSSYGDVFVIVGHDANIRLLKGAGHPLLPQEERRYLASSIRYVHQALVSTGQGWLDADPEIQRLKPDLYVVNEDGDRGGKREYCAERGIDYLVLKRIPAPGLPQRSSTDLRGF